MPISKSWNICLAQRYEGKEGRTLDWNAPFINDYCAGIANGTVGGSYGVEVAAYVRRAFLALPRLLGVERGLQGTTGMVLGSEFPWVECLAINEGADLVWTFEYSRIESTHPKLLAKPTKVMAAENLAGTLPLVDWIATYSSLEHSGLGRYGDAINPDGDKEAVAQAWCMLK
jgi:hypothetical protein